MSRRTLLLTSLWALTLISLVAAPPNTRAATEGASNNFFGTGAGANTTGLANTFIGGSAGVLNTTGGNNTFIGGAAGANTTSGSFNTFLGRSAGVSNTTGGGNTFLGREAGAFNSTGSSNVFVGRSAGFSETGSSKLYIDSSDTSAPLIYGDFTNGSELVGINGDLGVGTNLPLAPLHILQNASGPAEMLRMENDGGSFFSFENTTSGGTWFVVHEYFSGSPAGPRFLITHSTNTGPSMDLSPDGNLTIAGSIFTAGSCSAGCDRVFASDYELPTIEEHAAAMWRHHYLPVVGPTPEEGQPFNLSDKTERMLNELEKAHIYIEQLKNESDQKGEQIAALTQEVAGLKAKEARLEALEGQMATLKENKAQLKVLTNDMAALKALMHHQTVQHHGPTAPGKEG